MREDRIIALPVRARPEGSDRVSPSGVLAFGLPEMDSHLPGGGLRLDGIHEIMPTDFTARAAAFGFLIALLGRLSRQQAGTIVLCDFQPPTPDRLTLYGPGLMALGLDPGRLIHIRARREVDFFWALEEALSCAHPLAVVGVTGVTGRYDFTESKRLKLRAHRQGKPLFLLRAGREEGATACATRWRVTSLPGQGTRRRGFFLPGLDRPGWRLSLTRASGTSPQAWAVRWDHETLRFHLAAPVAARAPGATGPGPEGRPSVRQGEVRRYANRG